jgi:hypothetical protein
MKDADSERNSDMWRNAEALAKDGKKRVDCIGRYDQFDIEGILIARSSRDGSIWVSTQRPFCDRQ